MKINYSVPLYGNTKDDTHCFQAAIKMVMKYFWPKRSFTWKQLERMTAKIEGLWTWQYAGLIWMQDHGFEIMTGTPNSRHLV